MGRPSTVKVKKQVPGGDGLASHQDEEDRIGRELQVEMARGNHLAVFKLWQRVKSLDNAPQGCLDAVVRSMQRLGKPNVEIISELRSAVECNIGISAGIAELLDG